MKKINKYFLEVGEQTIALSAGAKILSVEEQRGRTVMYALVDQDAELVNCTVRIIGTGHEIEEQWSGLEFVGTVKMFEGQLMWHVWAEAGFVDRGVSI